MERRLMCVHRLLILSSRAIRRYFKYLLEERKRGREERKGKLVISRVFIRFG